METARRVRDGESPEAARQVALREFGNMGLVAEVTRNQWGLGWLEHALGDIRYSVRSFLRAPLFSAIVIITLALGIGSSTTIFSLLDGILLRALPFPNSNQLMMLWEIPPQMQKTNVVNLNNFVTWRERNHSFQSMAAFLASPMNLLGDRGGEQVPGLSVTADFFETLGTPPLLGRTFRPASTGPRSPAKLCSATARGSDCLAADLMSSGRRSRSMQAITKSSASCPQGSACRIRKQSSTFHRPLKTTKAETTLSSLACAQA